MKYFYDTEFLEDGKTIELISIGLVREDGKEYYAVNANMPVERIVAHDWLRNNVWNSLPTRVIPSIEYDKNTYLDLDYTHPSVKSKDLIASEVLDFLLEGATWANLPELWAWFAAYDHVVLAQLWGVMINMPTGIPQYTKDIRQLVDEKKFDPIFMPQQKSGVHNALEDARHNKRRYDFLASKPWKDLS